MGTNDMISYYVYSETLYVVETLLPSSHVKRADASINCSRPSVQTRSTASLPIKYDLLCEQQSNASCTMTYGTHKEQKGYDGAKGYVAHLYCGSLHST